MTIFAAIISGYLKSKKKCIFKGFLKILFIKMIGKKVHPITWLKQKCPDIRSVQNKILSQ